jgi:hypothetical protein
MTPGVSMLLSVHSVDIIPLTFEVLHNVEKFVVDVGPFLKLDLNLIKISKSVFHVERTI